MVKEPLIVPRLEKLGGHKYRYGSFQCSAITPDAAKTICAKHQESEDAKYGVEDADPRRFVDPKPEPEAKPKAKRKKK